MTPNGTGCPMRPCGIATETGALAMLPRALICRAGVHLQDGRVLSAASLIAEADDISTTKPAGCQ